MKFDEIIFDEHLEMHFFSEDLNKSIRVVLSDSLYASEEELTESYRMKISDFINNLPNWYNKSVDSVLQRAKTVYNIDAQSDDVQLMSIFVLFEQDEKELYGLSFRVNFDVEHGCGLKITNDAYEITEIGSGDVAFC